MAGADIYSQSKQKMEKIYPNFFNPNLASWIGCTAPDLVPVATQAFTKVCFRGAVVACVESVRERDLSFCIWRVYYHIRNEKYDYGEGREIPPIELPQVNVLGKFVEDIVSKCAVIDVKMLRWDIIRPYTIVIDYKPRDCVCEADVDCVPEHIYRLAQQADFGIDKLRI